MQAAGTRGKSVLSISRSLDSLRRFSQNTDSRALATEILIKSQALSEETVSFPALLGLVLTR